MSFPTPACKRVSEDEHTMWTPCMLVELDVAGWAERFAGSAEAP